VLGVFVTLVGAGTLIGNSVWFHQGQMLGNICGLVTGAFFAAYLITVSYLRNRLSAASVMYYSTIVTATTLLPFALFLEGNLFPDSLNGWIIILALAGFSHVGGQGLIAFALAYLGASFSAVTLILEIVSAALLGWLFLSESIEMLQWFGGVIIVLGIMIARRGSSR
jgi:drug/metabolite transporter (DMT)-like permease